MVMEKLHYARHGARLIMNYTFQGDGNIFSLKGRITRKTFVMTQLCVLVFFWIFVLLHNLIGEVQSSLIFVFKLLLMYTILTFTTWISLATHVKRWHDRNKSGWMVLINLIVILILWSLIELCFYQGTKGNNKYGPDPKDKTPLKQ